MTQAVAPALGAQATKRLTLLGMSLGFGVVQLDVTIVNTALESIDSSLHGGVSALQWVVSSYTIAFAALILTAGALGDRLGAKRVFIGGFAVFTAASLACALAMGPTILIAARAAQGVGAALLVPNSLSLLNHTYPDPKERGRAVGWWLAGASAALTAGPPIGGALIALVGWRSIFLVNLPIGLAGLWLGWRFTADTPPASRQLDLLGQGAAIGALGALAAGLIEGGRFGWTNPWVIAAFGVAAALGALFVVQEQRASQPMLPLSLFANRTFTLTTVVGLLINIPFYGLIFVFSLYFQQIKHLSPLETGLAFVPMMGLVLPVNLLAPRLAERFGPSPIVAVGAILSAAGCLGLLGIGPDTSYWAMLTQLLAMSAGLALCVPPLTSELLGSVEQSRSGLAAGVLNSARQTGSVLGVALFGSLIGGAGDFLLGAHVALVVSALLLVAAAAIIAIGSRARAG
jgi:DHA2 family methylenomycin A resistance protein-like MFS transporter